MRQFTKVFMLSVVILLSSMLTFAQYVQITDIGPVGDANALRVNRAVLYDQISNPGTDGGITAQDFEASFDAYDAEAADDFIIPSGITWDINNVQVLGTYSVAGPCNLANVRFYADNAGTPGTLLDEHLAVAANPDGTGNLDIDIPTTTLGPGTYWVSVQGKMDYGTGGQWYWSRQAAPTIGYEFNWRNPLDGFASGNTSWVDGSVMWPTSVDFNLSFAINGDVQASSVSGTYTAGNIPTSYSSYDPSCSGIYELAIALPTGVWEVTSVDVVYNMTAGSGAWKMEQRSRLECVESGTNEASFYTGSGYGGTHYYSRSGLTFANEVYSGNITFVMQAYRTWGSSPSCGTNYNRVNNGTWTVTVNYIPGPLLGDLDGTVYNGDGIPMPGATVSVPAMGLSTFTEVDGSYELFDVINGPQDVTAWKDGYNTTVETVDIIAGGTVTQDFVLTKPLFTVYPLFFDETLNPNEYLTTYLGILNTGNGPGEWEAVINYFSKNPDGTNPGTPIFGDVDNDHIKGPGTPSLYGAPANASNKNRKPGTIEFSGTRDNHTGYFENASSDQLYSMSMLDYSYTTIGSSVTDASSGDFMNNETDTWYTTANWGAQLYSVDVATGSGTLIGSVSGTGGINVTGMACDRTTNTMYVCWTNVSLSGIGTIDLATGVVTPIGPTQTTAPGMIDIAIDGSGQMYGWCIVTDNSYTIDKTTGAVTLLGSLGVNINYGQGGNWDSEDDVIYMTSYVGGPEFRALDPVTGGTTYLGALPGQCTAFGVPGTGGGFGGWLSLSDYEGTVPGNGGSQNVAVNFDATGGEVGEVYTAEIVLSSTPDVGTFTLPVTMTIFGDPLTPVTDLEVELISEVTGQVDLDWMFASRVTFQYFMVKRNGVPIGTTTDLFYTDYLPDFGEYCYTVTPVFDEGNGVPAGPECIEWYIPALCWSPASLYNEQWPDVQEQVVLTLENCGDGTLEFLFPDYVSGSKGFACDMEIWLYDSWGDGWNGGSLDVFVNGNLVLNDITIASGGGPVVFSFPVEGGDDLSTVFTPGGWPYECSYEFYDGDGNLIYTSPYNNLNLSPGTVFGTCPVPSFITNVAPAMGAIPSGSTLDVVLTYNSNSFPAGLYDEYLQIETSDPLHLEDSIFNQMLVYIPGQFYGTVTDCNTGSGINGVTVTAAGSEVYSTETDPNGYYEMYVDEDTYDVAFELVGYEGFSVLGIFAPEGVPTEINASLCEDPYAVPFVFADPNDADTECMVTWALPMGPYMIAYDDGTAEDYFAWSGYGGMSAVKFTPAGYPAKVQGARVFVGDGSFPVGGNFLGTDMEIMVFDDDGTDGMPGTAIDSVIVTVNNYGWVYIEGLSASFSDGDFYIVYRQVGTSPNVAPVGIDEETPKVYRSYVRPIGGTWMVSSYQDMMIRAIVNGPGNNVGSMARASEQQVFPGKLLPKAYIATGKADGRPGIQGTGFGSFKPIVSADATRNLENYTIARASDFDPNLGPETGTLTPLANPTGVSYNDAAFGGLAAGFYAYAVKAVYTSNESEWVYSNVVAHGLDNVVTFNVSQCDGEDPTGAVVNIAGQDYPYQDLSITLDATGIAVFDSVINGLYDLTVTKAGYTTYVHNDIPIFNDYTETVILEELMYPARKLSVEPLTSVAAWRSPYTLFLANEGFDEGTAFPPAGWQTTSYSIGWFHTDDGSSSGWNIPPGDGWYACASDDAAGTDTDGCCDYLIMPSQDLTTTDGFLVQFDVFLNGAYGQTGFVEYSTNGGATWTEALEIPFESSWQTYQIDLDTLAGEEAALVAFRTNDNGGWASGMAIDNVSAFWGTEPVGYVVSIDGGFVGETAADVTTYQYQNLQYGQTYIAEVRAKYSCGTSDPIFYTFTSNYLYPPRNLMDEYVYNTNEVPLLWNPPMTVPGPMLLNVSNNEVVGTSNHSLKSAPAQAAPAHLYTPENVQFKGGRDNHTGYFVDVAANALYSMDMVDYSWTGIGTSAPSTSTGDFMNDDTDVWYTTGDWGATLYSVDVTTGTPTFIANITGAQDDISGMACDRATNTMYIAWTDISQSGIGTIDLETGVVTPIGAGQSVAPGIIDIAIDGDGQMYAWGIVNDASYTIDKETGDVTMLGSLGVNLNYGQGGNWDSEDDVIYMTAYAGGPQLLVLDRVTGGTTFIESLFGQCTAFGVPGTGGGPPPSGDVPEGLYAFNVYRDGGFIAEVLYEDQSVDEWVIYVDNNLMPGCYSYDVTALYDLADYGFPGEYAESMIEGPDEVCLVWGVDLPFCEDWSIGTFEHNGWMVSSDNWEISSSVGDEPPSAQWNWDPDPGTPYVSSLTSTPFNADRLTEGSVMLGFDLALNDRVPTGLEMMRVEVYDGDAWYSVALFDNVDGSFDFTSYTVDITGYAMSGVFQVRFSAEGVNSFDVIAWNIDNICVYRECAPPYDLTGIYKWNDTDDFGAEICWEAAAAPSASQWFYYDDESIEYVWGSTGDWDADVAIKVPVADLVDFAGAAVTQYRAFVDGRLFGVGTVSVKVYQGENPDPSNPMYVEDVTDQFVVENDWNDFIFSAAVPFDNTQPLWIGMYFTGPADTYGPGITEDMGVSNPNGELYYEDGQWLTLVDAGINNRAWLLRGYVTTTYSSMSIAPINVTPLPASGLPSAGTLAAVDAGLSANGLTPQRALTVFNVYRMDSTEYELINSVPVEEGVTSYCYFDGDVNAQDGYYYQVTAEYVGETDLCESPPAMAELIPEDDFVYVFITGLGNLSEFSTNLYPNPAQDIVTVTSSIPMQQLTVTNYVGQVVYRSEMNEAMSTTLNTSAYQPGVYLVKIDTDNGVVTKRVIISR